MNVSFIGSGNLAWHLAPALDNAGFSVREVYSRDVGHAKSLVRRLYHGTTKTTLDFSDSPSRIFIIAATDDALEEISQSIVLPDGAILLHTSGSQPLTILDFASAEGIGVLYPLQTFTKSRRVNFADIPIFIESNDRSIEKMIRDMAAAISEKVFTISSAQRQALHVAAVFASNFTNHMITMSHDIMSEHDLDAAWLKPLLAETINKSLSLGPEAAQTGPARRGDLEILDRHLEFLRGDEAVAEIYRVISQHLLDRYGER